MNIHGYPLDDSGRAEQELRDADRAAEAERMNTADADEDDDFDADEELARARLAAEDDTRSFCSTTRRLAAISRSMRSRCGS